MTQETKDEQMVDAGAFQDEGVLVDLGFGNSMRFYPLTWGAMRRLRKQWELIFGGGNETPATPAWQDAAADILFASASRGNPGLSFEDFLDKVDIRNAKKCFDALAAASGMRRVEESTQGPGETAARPTNRPAGASSTQSSSPALDGRSQSAMN